VPDPRPRPIPTSLDASSVPHHVAIVMDGNGRWAQRQGLPRTVGHGAGEESLLDTTYGALSIGVKVLTVYAFSTENWRRPVDEVRYLMNFNSGLLQRRQQELHEQGVRITFSGRRDWRVPKKVITNMENASELTKKNKVLTLNIAFNYGGRAEIVDAVAKLEYRISNFLLWEMAYSELVFTDVLWPDFRRENLFEAVEEYQQRERRFGGLDK